MECVWNLLDGCQRFFPRFLKFVSCSCSYCALTCSGLTCGLVGGFSEISVDFTFVDTTAPRCGHFRYFRNQTVDLPSIQWVRIYPPDLGLWARNRRPKQSRRCREGPTDRATRWFGEGGLMTMKNEQITPADAAYRLCPAPAPVAPRSVIFPLPQRGNGFAFADSSRGARRIR